MKFLYAFFLSASPYNVSSLVVMFFRFVTSGEIRKRSEFFEPFILGLTNATVEQVCLIDRYLVVIDTKASIPLY